MTLWQKAHALLANLRDGFAAQLAFNVRRGENALSAARNRSAHRSPPEQCGCTCIWLGGQTWSIWVLMSDCNWVFRKYARRGSYPRRQTYSRQPQVSKQVDCDGVLLRPATGIQLQANTTAAQSWSPRSSQGVPCCTATQARTKSRSKMA